MRCLNRNKRAVYYALYSDKIPARDELGCMTGDYITVYKQPVKIYAGVSSARGSAVNDKFGIQLDYSKSIVTEDTALPADEQTVFWIDRVPELDEAGDTQTPYDYVTAGIARSINSVTIAVKRADVSP